MDKQELNPGTDESLASKHTTLAVDAAGESAKSSQKFYFESNSALPSGAESARFNNNENKTLESQGKLGKLDIIDPGKAAAPEADEDDGSEHVDVGTPLSWSRQAREHARPHEGQGYYDVMKTVGADLLGRTLQPEEVKLLVAAAVAVQDQRGKNSKELSVHDELLPKNEEELAVFMNSLSKVNPGPLGDRQVQELQQHLQVAFDKHLGKLAGEQVVLDLRPVKDQKEVTDKVPNAVYIDSSNIDGGQGYRRKLDCSKETQDYWLAKPTAEAFMRAQAWLAKNGHDPMLLNNMNAAGRRAIDRELISKCAPGQPHAKKHSQHEDGISVDVDNYDDANVRQALTREGFVHNVPGDRPHFTWLPKKK